jgi:hypothetical protein
MPNYLDTLLHNQLLAILGTQMNPWGPFVDYHLGASTFIAE